MADTTWRDVALLAAGAPLGALITVFGVALTNRGNRRAQQTALSAETERLHFQVHADLRGEHLRHILSERAALHIEAAEVAVAARDLARYFREWSPDWSMPAPDASDVVELAHQVAALRVRSTVHGSALLRSGVEAFHKSFEGLGDDPEPSVLAEFESAAESFQQCVVECAVADRVSPVAEDGLGGM